MHSIETVGSAQSRCSLVNVGFREGLTISFSQSANSSLRNHVDKVVLDRLLCACCESDCRKVSTLKSGRSAPANGSRVSQKGGDWLQCMSRSESADTIDTGFFVQFLTGLTAFSPTPSLKHHQIMGLKRNVSDFRTDYCQLNEISEFYADYVLIYCASYINQCIAYFMLLHRSILVIMSW